MPKVNTHLHLAFKLSNKLDIADLDSFFLGNAFPDCWGVSIKQGLVYHYKHDPSSLCDIGRFQATEKANDFNLGYLFHLWVDNRVLSIDTSDISKYDCLICDMEVIAPLLQHLKQHTVTGKECQAMQNILSLESEPMPLYFVSEEKKKRYNELLDKLVDEFIQQYFQ